MRKYNRLPTPDVSFVDLEKREVRGTHPGLSMDYYRDSGSGMRRPLHVILPLWEFDCTKTSHDVSKALVVIG